MTQILRPISFGANPQGWVTQLGATTNLYESIDDITPDASDYVATEGLPPPPPGTSDTFPTPIMDGGGLYGAGLNDPTGSHLTAGMAAGAAVPRPGGVFTGMGMSTTRHIWDTWGTFANTVCARTTPPLAAASQVAEDWAYSNTTWTDGIARLAQAGYTPAQVSVVWIMVVSGDADNPRSPTVQIMEDVLVQIKARLVNVRQVFANTYPYGGYKTVSAEPGLWDSGLVFRQWILNHLGQSNPWLGWGPYLWANDGTPRSDGLTWLTSDYLQGGANIHLSDPQGRDKAADLMEAFFRFSPLTPWYR